MAKDKFIVGFLQDGFQRLPVFIAFVSDGLGKPLKHGDCCAVSIAKCMDIHAVDELVL